MAACLILATTIGGTGAAIRSGQSVLEPLPWHLGDAVFSEASGFTCASGSHLLMTVAEVNQLRGLPSQWTAADGLTVGWSILAVWISVAAVMFLGKIVNWGSEREPSES